MSAPLIWLDLETTGLNPDSDIILEVGMVATDDRFQRIEGVSDFQRVIRPRSLDVTTLDPYVVEMHSKNGILAEIADEENSYDIVAVETSVERWLTHVRNLYYNGLSQSQQTEIGYYDGVKLLMAGSTVGQFDRQFFGRSFPDSMEFFDYRVVDVSSFKEVVRRVYGDGATYGEADAKADGVQHKAHRVLPDIEASIAELSYYVNTYFQHPAAVGE